MGPASESRSLFVGVLRRALPDVVSAVEQGASRLSKASDSPQIRGRRRSAEDAYRSAAESWLQAMTSALDHAFCDDLTQGAPVGKSPGPGVRQSLSLVDDETIEAEILSSRLTLAMKERACLELNDLCARINFLEECDELDVCDILRPEIFARIAVSTWRTAGLNHDSWRVLQEVLHEELSHVMAQSYHGANSLLVRQGVLPQIDLRPLIRRPRGSAAVSAQAGTRARSSYSSAVPSASDAQHADGDTRLMSRMTDSTSDAVGRAEAVLGRLSRLLGHQSSDGRLVQAKPASPELNAAIVREQNDLARRLVSADKAGQLESTRGASALLEELRQHGRGLRASAPTADERATIEVVALLFQSILAEDRIPAVVRVWFARLQMPVLRVAVVEPEFFASTDHPARKLIDCMGACVMGFEASNTVLADSAVAKEIKRVVQVIEAYPDTGSRVFQTVLTEFERFLEGYFKTENEASRKGVSLAEQVEQRETLAIQFTIELRKMLNEVPVQDGVREFLFHVWADVLATTAVKSGLHSDDLKAMKRAAADLIWSASAKVSHEDRADVIRRLPPLLKVLREGMGNASLSAAEQDRHVRHLNQSLAAAFTARSASLSKESLDQLMARLETLEDLMPDADGLEIDESLVLDLSAHESSDLEVVGIGGSIPTPAMLAEARELQIGNWFTLNYRGRNDLVQLAWHGMHRQLALFVSSQGRCILFQQPRLAAFLQDGSLEPVQDESLMERATRSVLAKLEVDPELWLH